MNLNLKENIRPRIMSIIDLCGSSHGYATKEGCRTERKSRNFKYALSCMNNYRRLAIDKFLSQPIVITVIVIIIRVFIKLKNLEKTGKEEDETTSCCAQRLRSRSFPRTAQVHTINEL
jgi:hypothetical protein